MLSYHAITLPFTRYRFTLPVFIFTAGVAHAFHKTPGVSQPAESCGSPTDRGTDRTASRALGRAVPAFKSPHRNISLTRAPSTRASLLEAPGEGRGGAMRGVARQGGEAGWRGGAGRSGLGGAHQEPQPPTTLQQHVEEPADRMPAPGLPLAGAPRVPWLPLTSPRLAGPLAAAAAAHKAQRDALRVHTFRAPKNSK